MRSPAESGAEIGLYYYRARYYDPKLGRFISEDPISFAGGDINLYAYVGNNPARFKDPSGLFFWWGFYQNLWNVYEGSARDARAAFPQAPKNAGQSDEVDAVRHCLASCRATREYGPAVAEFLGWINEKKSDIGSNQPIGQRRMDDQNNACGRGNAQQPGDCLDRCLADPNLIRSDPGGGPRPYSQPDASDARRWIP